jgi:hypothetical protein
VRGLAQNLTALVGGLSTSSNLIFTQKGDLMKNYNAVFSFLGGSPRPKYQTFGPDSKTKEVEP